MRPRPGIRSFEFWNRNFPRENFNYFPGIHYSMLIDTCPTFFLLFFLIFFKTRSDMNIARHAMATLLLPFLSLSLLLSRWFTNLPSLSYPPNCEFYGEREKQKGVVSRNKRGVKLSFYKSSSYYRFYYRFIRRSLARTSLLSLPLLSPSQMNRTGLLLSLGRRTEWNAGKYVPLVFISINKNNKAAVNGLRRR